jgi:hypothetical protein
VITTNAAETMPSTRTLLQVSMSASPAYRPTPKPVPSFLEHTRAAGGLAQCPSGRFSGIARGLVANGEPL